jgi:hypothetical protein
MAASSQHHFQFAGMQISDADKSAAMTMEISTNI